MKHKNLPYILGIIILPVFTIIFSLIKSFVFLGVSDKYVLSISEGLYFGIIIYFMLLISLRVFNSIKSLSLVSWLAFFLTLSYALYSAHKADLSIGVNGHRLFIDGNVTVYGFFVEVLNPIFILALFSTYSVFKRDKKVNH